MTFSYQLGIYKVNFIPVRYYSSNEDVSYIFLSYFQIDQDFAQVYSKEECGSLCREFGLIARNLLLQAKNCGRPAAEKKAHILFDEIEELRNADDLIGN